MTTSTPHPFKIHLSHFTSPAHPNQITFTSALKTNLSLGLNFPISVFFGLAIRILYSPSWLGLSRPNIPTLLPSQQRTQLHTAKLPAGQTSFSKQELLGLIPERENTFLNRKHVEGLWSLAADNQTGRVSRDDAEEFQRGALVKSLVARRRKGRSEDNVLPFMRGGPGSVAGHSWFVSKLFGVRVYEK